MVRSWLSHSHSGTREIAGLAALYGLYEVIRGAGTENVLSADEENVLRVLAVERQLQGRRLSSFFAPRARTAWSRR